MKIYNSFPQKIDYRKYSAVNKQNNIQNLTSKTNFCSNTTKLNGEYYRSLFNIKQNSSISFANLYHKNISSKTPIYTPSCTNYDDIDEFSKQFAKKINSQIQNPSLNDIEKLINNVQKATRADEKLVKEVLFRLSQFSSFQSLKSLDCLLESEDEKIGHNATWLSLTNSLAYLGGKFGYFDKGENIVSFIDDFTIREAKKAIGNKNLSRFYLFFGEKSYILDGFEILTSEGHYTGANFISGTGHLEALAIDVIKQIQNGKNIDDIMHGDLKKRFQKEFQNNLKLENEKYPIRILKKRTPKNIKPKDILKNLQEKTIDAKTISDTIRNAVYEYSHQQKIDKKPEMIFAKNSNDKTDYKPKTVIELVKEKFKDLNEKNSTDDYEVILKKEIATALMKYLDCFCEVFSAHSMSYLLNKMGNTARQIEKSTKRKNVYAQANAYKSSSLITYMFMKNNEIPFKRQTDMLVGKVDSDKNCIFLEDNSISGESELNIVSGLIGNVYFMPLVVTNAAIKYNNSYGFKNTVPTVLARDMIDLEDSLRSYLKKPNEIIQNWGISYRDLEILNCLMLRNYGNCGTAVAFPFILPDNNSDFASELLNPLLIESTRESRKS